MSPEVLIGKILVLLALAIALIYFGLKLKMPAIIGFLATGLAVGPQGLDLLGNDQRVEALSELGVVLLLFTIGLEFSIVLAKYGQAMNLLSADQMTMFLNAAVPTMAMTPLAPDLRIVARTRFLINKPALMALGADEVLTKEYEAGLSIFNSVPTFYEVPEEERNRLPLTALTAGPDNFHLPKDGPLEPETDPSPDKK